ncbi:hypothetical protein HGO38_24975 [Rhizobium sp. CG5]|uniref:HPr kinase/phosphorylase n=1 Tax=Rhizobium sp. CG5 TaxID=2726076 RepID=UPI002033ED13|nr:hypothetical protein [Rhizobium sp. CG5]MCM2476705.1 hypothetical protein [Rhizobium sp. CG5]
MSAPPANVHATAIVVGTMGLLFLGPSGAGKSSLAFACLADAHRRGQYAALVSDDRVLISTHGDRLIASGPASIQGLLELRHSAIVRIPHIGAAVLDYAILPVARDDAERLPPEDEIVDVLPHGRLPAIRIARDIGEPLASIAALISMRSSKTSSKSLSF